MEKRNYNLLLTMLTDTISVWLDEMSDEPKVKLPWNGNRTAEFMAEAAMAALQAAGDIYESLDEQGMLKDE